MNDWFRSWHGAPTDNKWLVIARRAGVAPGLVSAVAWALFDHASQAADRGSVAGFDVETYSIFSGFDEAQVGAVLGAMRDKGVITEGRLAAWDRRQPRREDSSTNRTAAYRERKRTTENATKSGVTQTNAGERDVTQCDAGERDVTLDKIRGEEIQNGSVSSVSNETTDTAAQSSGRGSDEPADDAETATAEFDPAEQPEEWYWAQAEGLEGRGVARSQLGALKSLHDGNWKTLVPAMRGILRAKDPPSYVNKLNAGLRATRAANKAPAASARLPRNALPDFVASAMREGIRVEIGTRRNGEPKYQIGNTIYDMRGAEIGF